ncbi:MAG TPA: hypothetical protein VLS89_13445 [Candidatus Nanopelagicales bacterium]|nr:hypothetical protein [Candidatus Nanopelagicales bacterium]
MDLDLSTISPQVRAEYIRIGRGFGSALTLAQANRHLEALRTHGAALVEHGFGAADETQLGGARDMLQQRSVGRTVAKGSKKASSKRRAEAMALGRQARKGGQAILGSTARALREQGGDSALEAARAIEGKLEETRRSPGRDGEGLAVQLEVMKSALVEPAVAAAAAERGGAAMVLRLEKAIAELRAGNQKKLVRGTPEETEQLDLLDGLVVTLTRNARKAALAAAEQLGMPSLAAAFELSELYPAVRGAGKQGQKGAEAEPVEAGEAGAAEAPATEPPRG